MKNKILTLSLIALLSGGINNSYSQNHKSSEDSRLVIYGESDHMSKKQKNFMINSIDSLKNEGYNYFAIELPVEMDTSIQKYLTSNKNYQDENIKKLLKWESSNGALEVSYNFYKNGFKVVPIDSGETEPSKYKRINDTLVKIINERDSFMAENIEKILENDSSAKIVAYTGALHARETEEKFKTKLFGYSTYVHEYSQMAGILKKKGINPKTICLTEETNSEDSKYFDKIVYLK